MKAAKLTEHPSFRLMRQTDVQNVWHMQMPRWLFSDPRYADMSLDAKVTYTFLLNRFQLSRRNGWVNDDGEVFVIFPRKALAKELRICEQRVTAAFRKLAELQLIWEKRCGRGDANQIYCAVIVPFRARILIPETEMWAESDERPAFVLRNMPGAQIDFVITHVDREAGFAIGSRRLALTSRRYFFSTQPLHQPGSRVPCHVLAVGPRRCLVECYGYDVNLSQRDMSYAAIPDLREQYHPGDELTCVVKQFDRKAGTLEISVKETVPNPFDEASLRHPVGCRRRASIAGKYAGGVFCNLPDGAVVMCRYSFHYEDSDFKTGDTVMVVIQRYDEGMKQIFGKIVGR